MLYGIAGERRYGLSAVDGLVPCAEGNEGTFVMMGKMRCGHTVFTLLEKCLDLAARGNVSQAWDEDGR